MLNRKVWMAVAIALGTEAPVTALQAQGATLESHRIEFKIPPQPLNTALRAFSRASGIQLVYSADLVAGRNSPGISGSFAPSEALQRLLQDSGLAFHSVNDSTVVLEKATDAGGAKVLGPLQVEGTNSGNATSGANGSNDPTATEGTGSYTTSAVGAGTRAPRDPKEIQQSISVITQQQMQDQNITDTFGALNALTGITLYGGSGQVGAPQNIYTRGFAVTNITTDGGAAFDYGGLGLYGGINLLPDMAGYDHVELLRGSDGENVGVGNPSGTINLVRKKPLDHEQIVVDAMVGRWQNFRTQVDVTAPLLQDGSFRGRLVVASQRNDEFFKPANTRNNVVYGILEYDLTPSTLLTAGINYQKVETLRDYVGIPRYQDGQVAPLSRGTNLATNWTQSDTTSTELFQKIEQRFGRWKLTFDVSENYQHNYQFAGYPLGFLPYSFFTAVMGNAPDTQFLSGGTLTGSFDILGRKQEIAAGASYQSESTGGWNTPDLSYAGYQQADVFHWNPNGWAQPSVSAHPSSVVTADFYAQRAAYFNFRSEILHDLHVNGGVRFTNYSYHLTVAYFDPDTGAPEGSGSYDTTRGPAGSIVQVPGHYTPYAGVTYDLTRNLALYGSWASIFNPTILKEVPFGPPMPFTTGNTTEFGVKSAWLNNRLNATLAYYKVIEHNVPVYFGYPGVFPANGDTQCCYIPGSQLSKGVDAEVKGEILPGWQLSAGYTYNENSTGLNLGVPTPLVSMQPRHLLKLWTMAKLPGPFSALRVGGGVTAQTINYIAGTEYIQNAQGAFETIPNVHFSQGGYALLNLAGEYTLNEHFSVQLNIDNVTDRKYFRSIGYETNTFYGQPLDVTLNVRGRF